MSYDFGERKIVNGWWALWLFVLANATCDLRGAIDRNTEQLRRAADALVAIEAKPQVPR